MTEKNMREDDGMEIDLGKLFHFYLENWKAILISGVLLAAIAFGITHFAISPKYRASVTIYVNNNAGGQSISAVTGGDLSTAQKLVNTYVNIIKSDSVLEKVIEAGKLGCDAEDVREHMTANQIDDTEMFQVSITDTDPKMAAKIANAVADVAPNVISDFVEGSSTKVIDRAKVPEEPFAPSYAKNIVLGALLGAIVMGILLTLKYLFDMRLQDEDDIERYFDAPVLGQIPVFESHSYKGDHSAAKMRGGSRE